MSTISPVNRIADALKIAMRYGWIDGAHHKQWVIDQMVRVLAGDRYQELIDMFNEPDESSMVPQWDEGIAP